MKMGKIGIIGYGVYLPSFKVRVREVVKGRVKKDNEQQAERAERGLGLLYKSMTGPGEDTITMATEAVKRALKMAEIPPSEIGSSFDRKGVLCVGTESKVYDVLTDAKHVKAFLGMGPMVLEVDMESACDAGLKAVSLAWNAVKAGSARYGMGVGVDIALGPPGDDLEFACGAGGSAFVVGKGDLVASIEYMTPHSELARDFLRPAGQPFPLHFGPVTKRSYLYSVLNCLGLHMEEGNLDWDEIDHFVTHQPNFYLPGRKLPRILAGKDKEFTLEDLLNPNYFGDVSEVEERLRISVGEYKEKTKYSFVVPETGNVYAASTCTGLARILDNANPGEKIVAVSFGSGHSSTAATFLVEDGVDKRKRVEGVEELIKRMKEVNFRAYDNWFTSRIRKIFRPDMRFVAEHVEPLGEDRVSVEICPECDRIYYPPKPHPLLHECLCDVPKENISIPSRAEVKVRKLSKRERLSLLRNPKRVMRRLYEKGNVPVVEVGKGFEGEVEATVRRIYKDSGLIIYAPVYRPV